MNIENLSTLKIHTMSQDIYDREESAGRTNKNELYLTPEEVATATSDGLMSAADKIKLDKIEEEAQVNVQSDWNIEDESDDAFIHNKPIFLVDGKQTTTSTASGGSNIYTFTKSDGSISTLTVKNGVDGKDATTTEIATQKSDGLMSAADKKKLDGIRFEFIDGTLYIYDENYEG